MNNITIREAITEQDTAFFWEQLYAYYRRDLLMAPGTDDGDYFLDSSQYRNSIELAHDRKHDRCYYLLLNHMGRDIGFALATLYDTEDCKCFLMEFCVLPEFRGNKTGTRSAEVFLDWARSIGAAYVELNCDTQQRKRFWQRVGFRLNGADEWGKPLMLLPPIELPPACIEVLADGNDWQLRKLENGYLAEIGEDMLSEDKQEKLSQAVGDGKITFFLAKYGYRAVGMCSVVTVFSALSCSEVGILGDFYIEPVFRNQGIAQMLANAAQKFCKEKSYARLSVTCVPGDEGLYRSLGFNIHLGSTYAALNI